MKPKSKVAAGLLQFTLLFVILGIALSGAGSTPEPHPKKEQQEGELGIAGEGAGPSPSHQEVRQGQMICLDTDCIIDFLKNKPEAVEAMRTWQADLVTTEVSRFQVFLSILDDEVVSQRELAAAHTLFSRVEVLPFGSGSGEAAAKMLVELRRKGKIIDEADCFIAATMASHGCSRILTRNKKHFARIPGITVIPY